jgi:exodeoxyribonuclease V gamma subunit
VPWASCIDAVAATAGPQALGRVVVATPAAFDVPHFAPARWARPARSASTGSSSPGRGPARGRPRERLAAPTVPRRPAPRPRRVDVALDDLSRSSNTRSSFLRQRVGLPQSHGDDPARRLPRRPSTPGSAGRMATACLRDRLAGSTSTAAAPPSGAAASCARWERAPAEVLDDVEELVSARSAHVRVAGPDSRDVDVTLPDGTRVVGLAAARRGACWRCVRVRQARAKQRCGRGCGWSRTAPRAPRP